MQVATGWNSTFHMMAHLVEQKDAVSLVLASTDSASNLTLYKWRTAADYCKTLQPCEEATSLMSGSRHSTLPIIIPVLNILHKKVRDVSDGLADIRWALIEGLNNRWPQCEKVPVFAAASIVDLHSAQRTLSGQHLQTWHRNGSKAHQTAVCCASVTGVYVPPSLFIFPQGAKCRP